MINSRWELASKFVQEWGRRVTDPAIKDYSESGEGGIAEVTLCALQICSDPLLTGDVGNNDDGKRIIRDSIFAAILSTIMCIQCAAPYSLHIVMRSAPCSAQRRE